MSRSLLLCVALLAAMTGEASAHAMLRGARPGVGSTVAAPPRTIELDFSEGVVPSFSNIALRDGAGQPVRIGKAEKGGGAATLVARVPTVLTPGTYMVTWHAVSVDTHRTQGSFRFTVR